MASAKIDLSQNVDAVTHFLDVLNAPPTQSTEAAPLGPIASGAAVRILKTLEGADEMSFDDLVQRDRGSLVDVGEAIVRLAKSELIGSHQQEDGREVFSLTEDGRRLAAIVDKSQLAT